MGRVIMGIQRCGGSGCRNPSIAVQFTLNFDSIRIAQGSTREDIQGVKTSWNCTRGINGGKKIAMTSILRRVELEKVHGTLHALGSAHKQLHGKVLLLLLPLLMWWWW